jgi:hypothetical protein
VSPPRPGAWPACSDGAAARGVREKREAECPGKRAVRRDDSTTSVHRRIAVSPRGREDADVDARAPTLSPRRRSSVLTS